MVLTGERIENGIRSGKIPMAAFSNAEKKTFGGKREANVVHDQKGLVRQTTTNLWGQC